MKYGLLSVAIKNLKRKSFRTGVLVLSIGLLVSILVFGTSFIVSVSSTLKRASERLGADVLVVPVGARDFAQEVLLETKVKTFYMDKSIIDIVKQVEGVDKITYQTYLSTVMGVCCDVPEAKVVAFNQDTDFIVGPWLKKAIGRELKTGEAIIGYGANENLGLLDIDRSVLFGKQFSFVGVLERTGTGLDDAIFFSDKNIDGVLEKGKTDLKEDEISLIFVKVKEGHDPEMVSRLIENASIKVDVIARNDMGNRINSNLKDISGMFIITIVLASVLSVFLAWTIFSAIVNERSREVGIMKALGARGHHIVKMFLLEVFMLGFMGSLSGIVLGTYLSISLSRIFNLLRDVAATMTLLERVEIGLFGLAVGVGVCMLGALSSIIRVKRLEPLAAMKEI